MKLEGTIDEDNELRELLDRIPPGPAIFDLAGVHRINSWGVRDWVKWLESLEASGVQSVLTDCSPAIVAQLNIVASFAGHSVVDSIQLPYLCPECDDERMIRAETSQLTPSHEPPPIDCSRCGAEMEFDDLPAAYFSFLR